MSSADLAARPSVCANCGAAMGGPFCPACGQSARALARPAFALAGEALGDLFALDGRLARTLGGLFTRPGAVARAFMDGKRAAHTPPIRLYLLASLLFLSLMAAVDMRFLAVTRTGALGADGGLGDINTVVTLFERGPPPSALTLTQAQRESLRAAIAEQTGAVSGPIIALALRAIEDPASIERAGAAGAAQALFAMTLLLALINAALHPRRRLIEHVVHSIYLHAVVYAVLAVAMAANALFAAWPIAGAGVGFLALGAILFHFVGGERGFYQSSWLGTALRVPFLLVGYLVAVVLTTTGLILAALL